MSYFSTFLVYLFYGLAFFSIGCAILFRNFRYSKLTISHSLWALAAFSFAYAFYEWSELYINLFGDRIQEPKSTYVEWLRLSKLSLAFLFLLLFAWMVTVVQGKRIRQIMRAVLLIVSAVYLAVFLNGLSGPSLSKEAITSLEVYARFILAFPATLIAGACMISYGRQLADDKKAYGRYFRYTGYTFLFMSLSAGAFPVEMDSSFFYLRVGVAYLLLLFLYLALNVFDKEKARMVESQLHQAYLSDKYKAIGQLASGVAHEINNPLASSTLSLDMLENRLTEKKQLDLLNRTRLGIDRAATICTALLNYSRSAEEVTQQTFVNKAIGSALQLLAHKARDYNISICGNDSIYLFCNPIKLEELVINLVSNAIDASGKNKNIKIKFEEKVIDGYEYILLSVTDNGCGMDIQTQNKAVEPFFTTKPIGQGTGLGLAICAQIAADQKGTLAINSTKGVGTTVTATLAKEI
ncbi:sensor histidine kinase [Photobacterium rosenbergii]|uniref:sensor histidine kinase n=1 Tax=Photobacterium rosenbergii TaxID=294936 RepID=UPI001C997446|nr:HAMP domain-containing sensor histidine kinase [Photobacterium rosenbergii]MBY5945896.1 HAMP domain-containing histidine kinase [Photobacterium rosenbergii]